MVSKSEKGGAAIAIAPIVASGLLATATKLYRDMLDEQKKVRRGGNAEVEAASAQDVDLFTSKSAPVAQEGGKKTRKTRKPKKGGFEEEQVQAEEQVNMVSMEGGKKRKSRKAKKGGFEEVAQELAQAEEQVNMVSQEGGKKRKSRKAKKGGFEEVAEELAQAEESALVQEGGKKKPRKTRKVKKGGDSEELMQEVENVLQGGKAHKKGKKNVKKGGADDMLPGMDKDPNAQLAPIVSAGDSPMQGGKPRKARGKKRGGNSVLGLYEAQLGGIATRLSNLVGN